MSFRKLISESDVPNTYIWYLTRIKVETCLRYLVLGTPSGSWSNYSYYTKYKWVLQSEMGLVISETLSDLVLSPYPL